MKKNSNTLITVLGVILGLLLIAIPCKAQRVDANPYVRVSLWGEKEKSPSIVPDQNPLKSRVATKTARARANEETTIADKYIKNLAQMEPLYIEPLLGDIEYGCYEPYNELCPKIHYGTCNFGEGMSAGTAASPLAQILTYYKYPEQMCGGTIDYYTPSCMIHRVWDCENTHFNWSDIKDSYGVEEYLDDKTVNTDKVFSYLKYAINYDDGWAEYSFQNTENLSGYFIFQLWLADGNNQLQTPASDVISIDLNSQDGFNASCKILVDNKLVDASYKLVLCVKVASKLYICQSADTSTTRNYFELTKKGNSFEINGNVYKCVPSYTNAQGMEIANLIASVGAALRLDYRGNVQNTQDEASIYKALVEHFGYDSGIASVDNLLLNEMYLHIILHEELAAGRPVYGILGPCQGFVVDGYQKKDGEIYYHVNWGNYGFGNGYYLLEDFYDPGFGNFIWGIQPASDNPTGVFVRGDRLLKIDKDIYKQNQKISIDVHVINFTKKLFDGDFVAYALGLDGKKYYLGSSKVDRTLFYGYVSNMGHPIEGVIPEDIPEGEYLLAVYSRQEGVERLITFPKTVSFEVTKGSRFLSLDKHQLVFTTQGRHQLVATCTIPGEKLIWSSSNTYKCPVDQNGVVTVRSGGQFFITVSTENGEYQDVCRVDFDVLITDIMLLPYNWNNTQSKYVELAGKVGETLNIYVRTYPQYANTDGTKKTCSDNSVLEVNRSLTSEIYCIKEGEATVTYTSEDRGDVEATALIRVYANSIPVWNLGLSETSLDLELGQTKKLSAIVTPENADVNDFKWSSSNPEVATVDENGKVTAVGEGNATITVELADGSGMSSQCEVTVKCNWKLKLSETSLDLDLGQTKRLVATVTPVSADVKWSSSNTEVATVDESGNVTAVGEGNAIITVELANESAISSQCKVTVKCNWKLNLSETSIELDLGQTKRLVATVAPVDADVKWSSSNTEVATVDENGNVTAVGEGNAIITVELANGSAISSQCKVTVYGEIKSYSKYFLLEVNKIQGDRTIQIGEFALLDENGQEIDGLTCFAGTDSKHNPTSENWDKLTDKNAWTKYCNTAFSNPAYFYFGIDHLVEPIGYRIYTSNDDSFYKNRHPVSWKLYESHVFSINPQDSCWHLIDKQENSSVIQPVNATPFDFFFDLSSGLDNKIVISNESMPMIIYTITGKLFKVISSPEELNDLPSGIYIVNGKPIIK